MTRLQRIEPEDRWRIYETAVHVAWGDQRLAAAEVSAARVVAEELDLASSGRCAGTVLREGPRPWSTLGLSRAPEAVREIAYGTAVWMALIDGVEHPRERSLLRALRSHLGLSDEPAEHLEACAHFAASRDDLDLRPRYRALLRAISDLDPLPMESGVSAGEEPR